MKAHPAAELFPMMPDDELDALAEDIKVNGLNQPVVLHEGSILDGRNRSEACRRAGVNPETVEWRDPGCGPVAWVISQNMHRRHLTAGQKAMLALEVEPMLAAEAEKRRVVARKENLPYEEQAREKAGAIVGVSGRSVSKAKKIAREDPELANQVTSGEVALDRAERILRDRDSQQKRIARAQAETKAKASGVNADVRAGDFRQVLQDLQGVSAIITDPPYPREYLPLLSDLARIADQVLAEDGVMAVLLGQSYLPQAYQLLGGHRPYRWTACYHTPGPGYVAHQRKVQSNWKPLLIYGGQRRFGDFFSSEGFDADAKENHKWGQDFAAFQKLVGALTEPGETVLDPFMGSGTTLLAAKSLGRHSIGCDVDAESVRTAKERLA